jgi:K+ transporter
MGMATFRCAGLERAQERQQVFPLLHRESEGLFAFLYRNAKSATHQFCIPPTHVVEIGTQIDL